MELVNLWATLNEFLALSGLRHGEAIALNKKDVDLKNMVIHVSKTYDSNNQIIGPAKNDNSIDDVVIQPQLADFIRRINAMIRIQQIEYGYRSPLFISNKEGGYINYFSYNNYFRVHTKKIIGRPLSSHSLRHTHASLLFEAGFRLTRCHAVCVTVIQKSRVMFIYMLPKNQKKKTRKKSAP